MFTCKDQVIYKNASAPLNVYSEQIESVGICFDVRQGEEQMSLNNIFCYIFIFVDIGFIFTHILLIIFLCFRCARGIYQVSICCMKC